MSPQDIQKIKSASKKHGKKMLKLLESSPHYSPHKTTDERISEDSGLKEFLDYCAQSETILNDRQTRRKTLYIKNGQFKI